VAVRRLWVASRSSLGFAVLVRRVVECVVCRFLGSVCWLGGLLAGWSVTFDGSNISGCLMFRSMRWVVLLAGVGGWFGGRAVRGEEPLTTIAFGSCAKQDQPQPIWQAVRAVQPQ